MSRLLRSAAEATNGQARALNAQRHFILRAVCMQIALIAAPSAFPTRNWGNFPEISADGFRAAGDSLAKSVN